MYPELFDIGPVHVRSFGVMMALAFVAAGVVAWWQLRRRGENPELVYNLLIGAIVGGIVGSKIHYLIVHPDQFELAAFSGSGLIWYGGLFGGTVGVVIAALVSRARIGLVADIVAPSLAMGYAVGRLGCFLNGDDYGKPTSLPWAMSFPEGEPPTTALVHPTQLYESLASLVIFALLVWFFAPRLRGSGSLFGVYLVLAGIERFLVEFVRTNASGLLGLTQQQWISIALIVVGFVVVWRVEGGAAVTDGPARSLPRTAVAGASGRSRPAGSAGSARAGLAGRAKRGGGTPPAKKKRP